MAVRNKISAIKNPPKHLLGIQNLSIQEAKQILKDAKEFISLNRSNSKKLEEELDEYRSQKISLDILEFENQKLRQQLDDYLVSKEIVFSKIIIDNN